MSTHCCEAPCSDQRWNNATYKKVLWIVLAINAAMFLVELVLGFAAASASLQADALDFLGDTASYGISLMVVGMALHHRARAALLKGISMAGFGVWIIANVVWNALQGTIPEATIMGLVGFAALLANVLTFLLLCAYRSGDSNMRSVWLCSRNDVIGNCAVLLAAAGVFGTSQGWPDLLVAAMMGTLALQGGAIVIKTAALELAGVRA